jgi:hypothetical protein
VPIALSKVRSGRLEAIQPIGSSRLASVRSRLRPQYLSAPRQASRARCHEPLNTGTHRSPTRSKRPHQAAAAWNGCSHFALSGLDSGVSSQIIGLARGNIGSKTPGGLLSSMDERTSVRLFASVLQTASPQAQKIKRASVEWLWCTECDRDQCRLLRIKIRSGASCTSCAVGELVRL